MKSWPEAPAGPDRARACLTVEVPCPGCGAPVRMDPAARTVSCDFCRRRHFLRGRRAYLTTFLEPRVRPADALLAAKRHLREGEVRATRLLDPDLVYAPYWRVRARLFKWTRGSSLVRDAAGGGAMLQSTHTEVLARDFDHTFPACSADTGVWGLSTRPAMLEVKAFDPARLPDGARWLKPEACGTKAREEGLARVDALLRPPVEFTVESGRLFPVQLTLTLVFFPFYVVRHRFRDEAWQGVIVDAVGGGVTADHPEELLPATGEPWLPDESGLSFLPLACPDCTFALDFRELDEVGRCPNCHRGWEVGDERLEKVDECVEDPGAAGARLLPFWTFTGELTLPGVGRLRDAGQLRRLAYEGPGGGGRDRGDAVEFEGAGRGDASSASSGSPSGLPEVPRDGFRVLFPAFDARHAEKLHELAVRFTLADPRWEPSTREAPGTCRLGREQAAGLADLCLLQALAVNPKLQAAYLKGGSFTPSSARLVWVPFYLSGTEYQEPRTAAVVPEMLLRPWE
ncbi:MAG: hypothetical protein HZB25_08460 [Candidatus Eisenbacteria bacterium]|nr:hypothetical protein [Candidatus Eisenbacteria bacterium]